jgi:hypothetical protein
VLSQRVLGVTVASLPGGVSAVRADGEAVWLTPRPSWERIPTGVTRVVFSGSGQTDSGRLGPYSIADERGRRSLHDVASEHHRDFGFASWAGVGFLLAFGVVAILSIGAPILLLGVLLLGILVGRGRRWPHSLGLLAGLGAVCLVIALLGAVAGPALWGVSGLALAAVGSGAFWWLRCRPIIH